MRVEHQLFLHNSLLRISHIDKQNFRMHKNPHYCENRQIKQENERVLARELLLQLLTDL